MSIIAPPVAKNERKATDKEDKAYFSKVMTAKIREMILTEDGRQMTIAQAIAERMAGIALYAESNQDAIAAAKVIWDRVEGKPRVIKDDEAKPMPRLTIRLNGEQYDRASGLVMQDGGLEEEDEVVPVFEVGNEEIDL